MSPLGQASKNSERVSRLLCPHCRQERLRIEFVAKGQKLKCRYRGRVLFRSGAVSPHQIGSYNEPIHKGRCRIV